MSLSEGVCKHTKAKNTHNPPPPPPPPPKNLEVWKEIGKEIKQFSSKCLHPKPAKNIRKEQQTTDKDV